MLVWVCLLPLFGLIGLAMTASGGDAGSAVKR
jgi:hypothetical protein